MVSLESSTAGWAGAKVVHWNNATHRGRVLNRFGAGIDSIEKIGELQYIDTICFIKAK
jgi:hypothetical protein